MNDIKDVLAKALPPTEPPASYDVDGLELLGQRSVRRRRYGYTAGAVMATVAVAAAALALPGAMAGQGVGDRSGSGAAAKGAEQPEFPLPELDPFSHYGWVAGNETDTVATRRHHKAFWTYLKSHHGGFDLVQMGEDGDERVKPGPVASLPRVSRYDNELWTAVETDGSHVFGPRYADLGSERIHQQPVYQLVDGAEGVRTVFGEGGLDVISYQVHPRDGFVRGAGDIYGDIDLPKAEYLVEGCEDYRKTDAHKGTADDRGYDFTCGESEGPDGEGILTVHRSVTFQDGTGYGTNTVVVYRVDGTALVVSDEAKPPFGHGNRDGSPGRMIEPALSIKDLTSLALGMPTTIVK